MNENTVPARSQSTYEPIARFAVYQVGIEERGVIARTHGELIDGLVEVFGTCRQVVVKHFDVKDTFAVEEAGTHLLLNCFDRASLIEVKVGSCAIGLDAVKDEVHRTHADRDVMVVRAVQSEVLVDVALSQQIAPQRRYKFADDGVQIAFVAIR